MMSIGSQRSSTAPAPAWCWWLAVLFVLSGCTTVPRETATLAVTPWAQASIVAVPDPAGGPARGWHHQALPGKKPVDFSSVHKDGRHVLAASGTSAASVVRHRVRIEPAELTQVRFSWKVPQLIPAADLAVRETDDSPVRVMLAFEGDRSKLSSRDLLLSELARTVTGEELPYATLMYVWCNQRAPGTVVRSPRTDRIRKLVLESGPDRLNQWLEYERDIRADFERAFGEPPGALVGIALMTDGDNTRSLSRAWYGPVRLGRAGTVDAR